ncbi:extracellular solute-binding protein [Paenibacillus sp. LHD-117]|uniref:extracellular solute-binding protein n=1 Tax=Paenibacillus sp. LHD-117 TaxID=3071412 RepID=UPI0027DEAF61|nr:extracellular solute-binding protein [Paenibacillus sp. LHD-117]MDQ6419694.1 extracellular solute-binding protein [Paenibacillus sp. LHD-117]
MKKKYGTIVLASSLAMSMMLASACSNQNQPNNDPPAQSNQTENTGGSNKPADPLEKYPETVTVTQVLGFSPPQDGKTPASTTPETNGYVLKLKEMLNIDLKYLWTVPSDQFEQKFSLSVASGDLPDIMSIGTTDFEKFKEDGLLADLTDAYNNYASPRLKQYVEQDGGATLSMFKDKEGRILGLPNFEDPYMSSQILWIRGDWLANLKLEVPESLEELEQVAEAFVKQDPDQNGKDDTFGIAMNKDLVTWGFDARGLFHTMGAYPKAWVKGADGKLVAGEVQPETKKALEKLQSWYTNGLLDKEFAYKDINKVVEDVVAGKVGITFGEWWYPEWPLNLNRDNDPKADWKAFVLPSYEGKPSMPMIPKVRLTKVFVANKEMKNPEAMVKMANFFLELEDPKYKDVVKPEDGFVYSWYDPRFFNPTAIADGYMAVNEALKAGNADSLDPQYLKAYDTAKKYLDGDQSSWGTYTSRVDENGGWATTEKVKEMPVVFNEFAGSPTPTQVEKGASLDKLTDETFIEIIVGKPISEFDKYVESWKKLGGNDISDEVNEWYAESAAK